MKDEPIRRLFQTKALDTGNTRVVASTPDVDRYGDIVAAPWRLENFAANPVIPWGHDYAQPPVGRATTVGIEDGNLVAEIEWDDHESNPLGQLVASQFRRGMLSTVSVGFYPGMSTPRSALPEDDPRRSERGMIHTDNELLEISAVTIPANPNATVRGLSADAPELELLREWTALGFEGHLRETLIRLLSEDAAIRRMIESMFLTHSLVEPSVPDPAPDDGFWDDKS